MGRHPTCLCGACPKCERRARYVPAKLRPKPALVEPEDTRRTVDGRVPLTSSQRAELRQRIDQAVRDRQLRIGRGA